MKTHLNHLPVREREPLDVISSTLLMPTLPYVNQEMLQRWLEEAAVAGSAEEALR